MKKYIPLFLLVSGLFSLSLAAQKTTQKLKPNFAGAELQVDLFHSTAGYGITYERMLAPGKKGAFSVKGRFFLPHRNETLSYNNYKSDITASQLQFSTNGYLFLDHKERPLGVFLFGSLGSLYTWRYDKAPEGTRNYSGISSGLEGGIGGHVRFRKTSVLQVKIGGLLYFGWGSPESSSYFFSFGESNTYLSPVFSVAAGF